jgi:hypothetical protein
VNGDQEPQSGLLAEFQGVTAALNCAIDFQERVARRNRDMPAARALLIRRQGS